MIAWRSNSNEQIIGDREAKRLHLINWKTYSMKGKWGTKDKIMQHAIWVIM